MYQIKRKEMKRGLKEALNQAQTPGIIADKTKSNVLKPSKLSNVPKYSKDVLNQIYTTYFACIDKINKPFNPKK